MIVRGPGAEDSATDLGLRTPNPQRGVEEVDVISDWKESTGSIVQVVVLRKSVVW